MRKLGKNTLNKIIKKSLLTVFEVEDDYVDTHMIITTTQPAIFDLLEISDLYI